MKHTNTRKWKDSSISNLSSHCPDLAAIYEDVDNKNRIIAFVRSNSGNGADGEDVYHEAICVFIGKLRDGDFTEINCHRDFIFGIARLYWMNQLRRRKRAMSFVNEHSSADVPVEYLKETAIDFPVFLKHIQSVVSDQFMQIITLWMHGFTTIEIADELGFDNNRQVIRMKYKGMRRLTREMKSRFPNSVY